MTQLLGNHVAGVPLPLDQGSRLAHVAGDGTPHARGNRAGPLLLASARQGRLENREDSSLHAYLHPGDHTKISFPPSLLSFLPWHLALPWNEPG